MVEVTDRACDKCGAPLSVSRRRLAMYFASLPLHLLTFVVTFGHQPTFRVHCKRCDYTTDLMRERPKDLPTWRL